MGRLMRFYGWWLYHRYLHFLWIILLKKYETIKEIKIPYVVLPRFILGRDEDGDGRVLYHKSSGNIMIFVLNYAPFPRYTIWHEYREGQLFKEKKTREQIIEEIINKMPRIVDEQIDTSSKEFAEKVIKYFEQPRKITEHGGKHFEALIDELILAKEEMSPQEYHYFFQFITKR